jgi:hypothetical protein
MLMNSKIWWAILLICTLPGAAWAQLTDQTQAPNTAKAGIAKSLQDETGAGRGDATTWNSSVFIIQRDPFRSIRRGRQLFQRKFTRLQGQGANEGDGVGDLNTKTRLGQALPTAAHYVTAAPAVQQVPAETSPPGRTAGTRRISSGSASKKCWPMKSPSICATFASKPSLVR